MMVSAAVVNALQDTMNVEENLKLECTLEELGGCFSHTTVLNETLTKFAPSVLSVYTCMHIINTFHGSNP